MEIHFYKYQGTGNDFVMIDDRASQFPAGDLDLVRRLCDRRLGIGADGLILIREREGFDFEMIYFNADGSQSMCGNGARCAISFSRFLGIITETTSFWAIDGTHEGSIDDGLIELGMRDVSGIEKAGEDFFIDTGSPHYVRFVEHLDSYPVVEQGRSVRNSSMFAPGGTNANFVTASASGEIFVRTYERGVEGETLSCGTGVTACAIVYGTQNHINDVKIKTIGGDLRVRFVKTPAGKFTDIQLIGPAEQVFSGKIHIS